MLQKTSTDFYEFSELKSLGLKQGFSTREMGDMQFSSHHGLSNLKRFVEQLDQVNKGIIRMQQIHGIEVKIVTLADSGSVQAKADGLITKDKRLFLCIRTADCLPLILFDNKQQTLAAVHAGYKGVYANIAQEAISKMIKLGSKPGNIVVGIGPSIRDCCYSIDESRVNEFRHKYPEKIDYLVYRGQQAFLSLQSLVKWQLRTAGVLQENIFDAMMCTQDHDDKFFSFRARKDKASGEVFATVVGL